MVASFWYGRAIRYLTRAISTRRAAAFAGGASVTGLGGRAAAVIGAVILAAAIAGLIAAAAAELLRAVLIAAAVIFALAGAAGAALLAYRIRHGRTPQALPAHRARVAVRPQPPPPVPRQAADPLPGPQRPAIKAPREVHLHFHGVTAEDVAAILARVNHQDHERAD